MMFDGLTSRWTTPCSWAYCRASATAAISSAASRSGGRPARQQVGQGHALDELADQVGHAVVLADLVDRHDRRVPQLGHAAGLAEEAVAVLVGRPGCRRGGP